MGCGAFKCRISQSRLVVIRRTSVQIRLIGLILRYDTIRHDVPVYYKNNILNYPHRVSPHVRLMMSQLIARQ